MYSCQSERYGATSFIAAGSLARATRASAGGILPRRFLISLASSSIGASIKSHSSATIWRLVALHAVLKRRWTDAVTFNTEVLDGAVIAYLGWVTPRTGGTTAASEATSGASAQRCGR